MARAGAMKASYFFFAAAYAGFFAAAFFATTFFAMVPSFSGFVHYLPFFANVQEKE
jgi:hypothetical protein